MVEKSGGQGFLAAREAKSCCPQSQSGDGTCTGSGISKSACVIQGHTLIIQLFLPEWRRMSNAGVGGTEELYPSVITIMHHPHASVPSRLREGMEGLQGWHPQAATAHREQLGLLMQTPGVV